MFYPYSDLKNYPLTVITARRRKISVPVISMSPGGNHKEAGSVDLIVDKISRIGYISTGLQTRALVEIKEMILIR